MVSAFTAHTMRQHKLVTRRFASDQDSFVYVYRPLHKGVLHPDHLPATIGLMGAMVVFSLMSLQLALTPFRAMEQQAIAYQEQTDTYLASLDTRSQTQSADSPNFYETKSVYANVLGDTVTNECDQGELVCSEEYGCSCRQALCSSFNNSRFTCNEQNGCKYDKKLSLCLPSAVAESGIINSKWGTNSRVELSQLLKSWEMQEGKSIEHLLGILNNWYSEE
jgi:hypothetical protein